VDSSQACAGMPLSSTSIETGSAAASAWASLVHLLKSKEKPGPWSGKPPLSTLSTVVP
jgi:hypothetical protein